MKRYKSQHFCWSLSRLEKEIESCYDVDDNDDIDIHVDDNDDEDLDIETRDNENK